MENLDNEVDFVCLESGNIPFVKFLDSLNKI